MQPPEHQPIGFWTARAAEAISERIRSRLAEVGVAQAEWWVLHQLSLHADGLDERRMLETIGPNDTEQVARDALEACLAKGWARRQGSTIHPTDAGSAHFREAARVQRELGQERGVGISREDYITTITTLQQVIRNVGGDAWHW